MKEPAAWKGDNKKGYKCPVCRMESCPAQGGRPGYETLHFDYCHALTLLTERVKMLEERLAEVEQANRRYR